MAIDYIKRRSGRENDVISRNVLDYGSIDLTGATQCTDVLNKAFAHAAEKNNVEITLPRGIYRISGSLYHRSPCPMIRGAGPLTVILADDTDYDWLTVGPGATAGYIGPSGYVKHLSLQSVSQAEAPSGFKAGLVLDGWWHGIVDEVWSDYAPIAADFRNNSMLTKLYSCRFGSFGRSGLGIRLSGDRTGMVFASGSDQNFYGCEIAGRRSAVWMERGGGGYNFHGCQLLSGVGLAAPDDDHGTATINKNLEEVGTVGGRMSARFFGTSFESVSNGWNVRIHDLAQDPNGCTLLFSGVSFTGGIGGNAIGVLKLTGGYRDAISFINCTLNGEYSNAQALDIDIHPSTGRQQFFEVGTQDSATFNGVARDYGTESMLMQTSNPRACSITPFHLQVPGGNLWLTALDVGTGSNFSKSANNGSSWQAV